MGQQTIHCSVNNCHYWHKGNECKANEIMVTSDAMSSQLTEQIDAPYAAQVGETPIAKCAESCCKTFVLKGDFAAFTDGVTSL